MIRKEKGSDGERWAKARRASRPREVNPGWGQLRGRVGPRADPDPSLWLSCMDQRALKVTRSRVPSKRSGVVGGERKRERRRMSEERGGGSVSTRWTRVGSPLATQRHQSLCSDRSFLRRDYQEDCSQEPQYLSNTFREEQKNRRTLDVGRSYC